MKSQDTIKEELRSLNSSLPADTRLTPFSVPEGYFEGLAEAVLAKIKQPVESAASELEALSPLLAGLPKKTPYAVPDGYFNENAAGFPFLREENVSPVLATVGKTMPYTVPEGYFETLPEQVTAKLFQPKAKVVPFFSRTWARAAVAAFIGGVVMVGGYRLLNDRPDAVPAATAQRSADTSGNLVAGTIVGGVTQYIQNISTEELDAFMNTVPAYRPTPQSAALVPAEKTEMKEWLKDVPEKDIDAFLAELPSADEQLMVID